MGKALLMAVDIGTSYIKAGIYDEWGNSVAYNARRTVSEQPGPGIYIQRGEQLFADMLACMGSAVSQVGERAKEICGIAFTGQMAGFMGVDEDWNDITGWSCSLDTRYIPFARKQMELYGKEFLIKGGTNAPIMAPKMEWFNQTFPEKSRKISKYLMLNAFCLGKLAGLKAKDAMMDTSLMAWTGLADICAGQWSENICEELGIEKEQLPRIVASTDICGYLTKEIAQILGVKEGIPLVAGAGDKVAGCVGAALRRKGQMVFEASSYGGFSFLTTDYRYDEGGAYDGLIAANPQERLLHKYIPGSGITLKWFLSQFLDGEREAECFMRIDSLANRVPPGCEGLMALGLLGGSAMPFDGNLRGVWIGHSWNHEKEHFYRSLLEGFSFELAITIGRIQELYPEYTLRECMLIGGGAKSSLWAQILADVTGCCFKTLSRDDTTLWGTALMAGKGIGLIENMEEQAAACVECDQTFVPDMDMHLFYETLLKKYQVLRDRFAKEFFRCS